jgi:hypothetical protein
LRDIFDVLVPPQYSAHQGKNALLVTPDELLERSLCTTLGHPHKFPLLFVAPPDERDRNGGSVGCHSLWDVCHPVLVTFETM